MRRRRQAEALAGAPLADALVYGASAVFALRVLGASPMLRNRTWAALAGPAYAAGALAAVVLAALAPQLGRRLTHARVLVAAAVGLATVVAPLAVEVQRRSHPQGLHPYAASEVVLTERSAQELVRGRDPYSTTLDTPELAGRGPETGDHFPYLPGMVAFGLPRAFAPDSPWTDARIFFLVAALAAAALAWQRLRAPPERRLRALQVLVVLPTGAAALATGGDDVPVLALCLLALVLFDRRSHAAAIGTAAIAALLKLTAWPLLLALAVATPDRRSRWPLAGVAAVVLAAAAVGPGGFVDDVLLFPAGLTRLGTPAETATLGSFVVGTPTDPHRVALTLGLAAVAFVAAASVLRALSRRRSPSAAEAAAAAGLVLVAAIALAPAGRSGYLVYPLELFAWAALLRRSPPVAVPVPDTGEAVAW